MKCIDCGEPCDGQRCRKCHCAYMAQRQRVGICQCGKSIKKQGRDKCGYCTQAEKQKDQRERAKAQIKPPILRNIEAPKGWREYVEKFSTWSYLPVAWRGKKGTKAS